jgi:hypothetical protein
MNGELRMVLVTGGPGAGKTTLCKRLYGEFPKSWRFVPLDNFIGISFRLQESGDWPEKTVKLGAICMEYWRNEKLYNVLVRVSFRIPARSKHSSVPSGSLGPRAKFGSSNLRGR